MRCRPYYLTEGIMKKNYNYVYIEWVQEFRCPVCQTLLYGASFINTCPHVLFIHDLGFNEFDYCTEHCEQIIDKVIDIEKSKGKDELDEDFLTGACEALNSITTIFFEVTAQRMFDPVMTIGIDLSL